MNRERYGDPISLAILLLASALGVLAFLHPLFGPPDPLAGGPDTAHAQDAPFVLLVLLVLCLVVIVANLETRRMDARVVAVLGVLAALNASLRLVSGPFGTSAAFFLPIVCGYVLGADFGFLLATLSMLASALLTGGLGPWLPFQMFAAGWCGMVAGWLPRFGGPDPRADRRAALLLAAWGGISGFLFGAAVNLWFWPYLLAGDPSHLHAPGLNLVEALGRYAAFYLATSSWWDAGRAVGNVVLLLAFGPPVLRLLRRFESRFRFRIAVAEDVLPQSSDSSIRGTSISGTSISGRPTGKS